MQPNAGGGPKFNKNLLKWHTFRALESDNRMDTRCMLAFPFNPHETNYWQKSGGNVLPLIFSEEALVGNEFWDLRNAVGKKASPGLYIYVVEADNGLSKIGKFAIVR